MNRKSKKIDFKKSLVRNTELSVPQTSVSHESQLKIKENSKVKFTESKNENEQPPIKNKFNSPELYSTLKLTKKIDHIVKPRKTKSVSDLDKKKIAVDDKVSRKVNFPFDQPIYKDLIPLCDNIEVVPQSISTRVFNFQKDKEPNLADFTDEKRKEEYYYQPKLTPRQDSTNKIIQIRENSLHLYKMLQIHKENIV